MNQRALFSISFSELTASYSGLMNRAFPLLVLVLVIAGVYRTETDSTMIQLGGWCIIASALLAPWLWMSGRITGLPIVPVVTLMDIFWYAFPVLGGHRDLAFYPEWDIFKACLIESSFLIILSVVWCLSAGTVKPPGRILRLREAGVLGEKKLILLSMSVLFLSALLVVSIPAQWAWNYVFKYFPFPVFTTARTFLTTLAILVTFLLAITWGRRRLSLGLRVLFLVLFLFYLMGSATSLLLSSVIVPIVALFAGYTLGRGRFPLLIFLASFFLMNLLHMGKWELRERYWTQLGGRPTAILPTDYPAFYSGWIMNGLRAFNKPEESRTSRDPADLFERLSMIHMYMMAQTMAPKEVPYLAGRTYRIIPPLFIPRVFWPNKPRTHEGQVILNVHFGRQTLEQTNKVYISWGTLAEAWANFGPIGPPLLAIIMGLFFGRVTGYTRTVPMGSLRFVVGILVMFFAVSLTQSVMSLWLTSLFQSVVVVCLLSLLVMRQRRTFPLEITDTLDEEDQVLDSSAMQKGLV